MTGFRIERRRQIAYRRDTLWRAALVHRLSGIGLAVFLPMHFLALGLALEGEARLDGFLRWADRPLFKLAEAGLVCLLAVHMLGGLRLLAIENLPWRPHQKTMATVAAASALLVAALFLLRII